MENIYEPSFKHFLKFIPLLHITYLKYIKVNRTVRRGYHTNRGILYIFHTFFLFITNALYFTTKYIMATRLHR